MKAIAIITKNVIKRKHYTRIKSETQYTVDVWANKTFYAGLTPLNKIKKD